MKSNPNSIDEIVIRLSRAGVQKSEKLLGEMIAKEKLGCPTEQNLEETREIMKSPEVRVFAHRREIWHVRERIDRKSSHLTESGLE